MTFKYLNVLSFIIIQSFIKYCKNGRNNLIILNFLSFLKSKIWIRVWDRINYKSISKSSWFKWKGCRKWGWRKGKGKQRINAKPLKNALLQNIDQIVNKRMWLWNWTHAFLGRFKAQSEEKPKGPLCWELWFGP